MYYPTLDDFKKACGYTIDGLWYPRVTAIVGMKAKPGLYKFYAEQESFEAGEAIKNKSAEEGTLVHETVEAILQGEQPVIPETIRPLVEAVYKFLASNQVRPLKVEERLISKNHHYSGTLDVLAEINGKVGVLDIKTSYSIFRDFGIQTSAYAEAIQESEPFPHLTRWILRLDQYQKCSQCSATLRTKGGNPKVRQGGSHCSHQWGEVIGELELKELPDYRHDFQAFLACKTLWEWENSFWLSRLR
jgi:hypothetical protein